ncbi:TOX high mobility group box family member 4-like isoform X7 [Leptotrombidium deliense]|uniref:TOX high mobility group box family member 4-like isoform X7 n=1 Tax=Leptotrombidium deliense TaxID=299467 RepID=A0A443SGA6_9ACAR|nr:TOX high mobility group box family member 4-like isoform X7 [Leptotrombidium deliense]
MPNQDSSYFKNSSASVCDQSTVTCSSEQLFANSGQSEKSWQRNEPQCSTITSKHSTKDNYLSLNGSKTKKKKVTRKKDVNKPPKPVSAYAHFFREKQTEIKSKNPDASFGEVSKIVASEWDSLPNETKVIYKKKADQEKHEYLRALATLKANVIAGNVKEDNVSQNSELNESQGLQNIATTSRDVGGSQQTNSHEAVMLNHMTNNDEWMEDLVWPTLPVHPVLNEANLQVPNRCIRLGCVNESCANPQWDNEYCSNDCAVSHCRDVFDAWLESRNSSQRND